MATSSTRQGSHLLRNGLAALLASAVWASAPFEALEARLHGRIGLFAMQGEQSQAHRAGERFAYCSSFKWVLGAAILTRADTGELDLQRRVKFGPKDLLEPCALTRAALGTGMTIAELCAAAIATSDNAATNLLEPMVGGPSGLQAFTRGLGDTTMRFDRLEPELNSNLPGDPRDTTTPEAMARLLRRVLEGGALSAGSRERLLVWMKAARTGGNRIPAGVPRGWTVAHKTGTGGNGAVNDVAVIFPPSGAPIYLCIFTEGPQSGDRLQAEAIAEATRIVLRTLASR